MKKYWNDARRTDLNQQRDSITGLNRSFNGDLADVQELTVKLNEQQAKQAAKVIIDLWSIINA